MKIRFNIESFTSLFILATFSILINVFVHAPTTHAAPVVGFQAGLIIEDSIFTDKDAMSASQIQSFLKSKVSTCDTWGTGGSTLTSRRDYIRSLGYDTPLKCLIDYTENGKSAAQIIYDIAQKYRINPQVLIVLLQKEQGLVTDDWPGPWQWKTATGYGCPDTAPCDSQYYGLTNQLDWAGKMYRAIMDGVPQSQWYTPYILGNNYIQYSPTASCGGSTVNIQNRATQALYNYTPYQPNAATLAAGYSSAACGAYGNRNFYLYFNDWFGSSIIKSQLVRTISNNTVYLIVGDKKYPVPSESIMSQLLPISGVGFAPQSYLDSKLTGNTIRRLVRNPSDGSIYLIDSGYKVKFTTCGLIADYGYTCDDAINLTALQLDHFITSASPVTNLVGTTSGKDFYIKNGQRREVYDAKSLQDAGLAGVVNRLSESSVGDLPYGNPIIRPDVFVHERNSDNLYVFSNSVTTKVDSEIVKLSPEFVSQSRLLDSASVQNISKAAAILKGVLTDSVDTYLVASSGKVKLPSDTSLKNIAVVLSTAAISNLSGTSSVDKIIVKTADRPTLYYIDGLKKRPLQTWADVFSVDTSPGIITIGDVTMGMLGEGNTYIRPGALIKSPDSVTVYLTLGSDTIIALGSFDPAVDLNIMSGISTVSQSAIDGMTKKTGLLTNKVQCGTDKYVGIGGGLYSIQNSTLGEFTIFETGEFCQNSKMVTKPSFIKTKTSVKIYNVNDMTKEPIGSWSKYLLLGGNTGNTYEVTPSGLDSFTLGGVI